MYKIDAKQHRRIAEYADFLARAIESVAGQAFDYLAESQLAWGTGRCDFAVNRRNNKEAEVPELRRRLALQGPVDHDVPVLKATRSDGTLLAIVFGYACHCTVLDFNKFCGDFAGFAQIELETSHRGAQAMFVAGCGGDQNPIPRRALELAAGYGKQLAESVEGVIRGPLKPIDGAIKTSYEENALAFATLPTKDQIERDAKSENFYIASRAKHLLNTIESRGQIESSYPYPVEVWRLGDLTWVFLGGEVVVDFALRIKRNLGSSRTWVSAYCNDVMAYIPSKRVLTEGGYEGATAMIYYGQPTVWSDEVEEAIIAAVARRLQAAGR
jgi:neutral ceramidase